MTNKYKSPEERYAEQAEQAKREERRIRLAEQALAATDSSADKSQ